jgi:predicted dehydrogenase
MNAGVETIKVGVIGAGFIGPLHVESLRRIGGVEVIALADQNGDLAKKNALKMSIPHYYGDWQDLISNPEIQVIHNCTPNFMHYEINKSALEAGKPLVAEKPVGMNSIESADLLRLANVNSVPNEVCFVYRMYPVIQQMKAMVEVDQVGEPWLITGAYVQDWLFAQTDYNWRVDPALSGPSRAVADIGSHWFEIAQFVVNQEIVAVCSNFETCWKTRKVFIDGKTEEVPIKTEDFATVLVRFSDGAIGTFYTSQVSAGRKNYIQLEVNGSKCSISWNHEDAERLWIGHRDKPNEMVFKNSALFLPQAQQYCSYPVGHPEGYSSGFKNLFQAFYSYLLSGRYWGKDKTNFPTFWEGHRSMLILEAIIKSAQQNCWIDVDFRTLPTRM